MKHQQIQWTEKSFNEAMQAANLFGGLRDIMDKDIEQSPLHTGQPTLQGEAVLCMIYMTGRPDIRRYCLVSQLPSIISNLRETHNKYVRLLGWTYSNYFRNRLKQINYKYEDELREAKFKNKRYDRR